MSLKESVRVHGVNRTVYLTKQVARNKWRGKIYVPCPNGGQTSVAGLYHVYGNGAKRFTPTGKNADMLK